LSQSGAVPNSGRSAFSKGGFYLNSQPKVMTAEEAVTCFVKDGDCLALGGFVTNRRPYALVREIIRQRKRRLYLEGGPSGGDADMLIGAGCVEIMMVSYIANSGYTMVCRRFRDAVEHGRILYDDYSLDVQTIAYHGAALGLSYVPVKNMLGSDLVDVQGISDEERKKHPKLPPKKFVIQNDPFQPDSQVCCVPTPRIDVACIHVQEASPDGTCRIEGPQFQDLDIAMAARSTIVSCERLASNEEMHRHPEYNTLTGLCVDAIVPAVYGAHPSQCFGCYDYDSRFYLMYDKVSRTQEEFDAFLREYVDDCPTHGIYLNKIGAEHLTDLQIRPGYGYRPGLERY
jgi:glutaconate CoA-transferase subunit A